MLSRLKYDLTMAGAARGHGGSRVDLLAVAEMVERVLELVAADAAALGCKNQAAGCRAIVSGGTSADAQLRVFAENEHEDAEIALQKVTRWICDTTLAA